MLHSVMSCMNQTKNLKKPSRMRSTDGKSFLREHERNMLFYYDFELIFMGKTLKSTIREKMACVTQRTSIIVYAVFHLISSLVICTRADVIGNCANVTTCIGTYADIYKSCTSDENSFNIESALYPANEPSSVLVFVNIHGQNGSHKTADDSVPGVIKYTWSLRGLYAAFPAVFLEISSLFSITVTSRTQELNITIPYFCCNVSVKDRKRMIKNVLAALQDLAVIPGLRDPRLNFAESVIEGHTPDLKTTGLSYLRAVLWFSLLCPMFFSPFLYLWVLQHIKNETKCKPLSADSNGNCCRVDYIFPRNEEPLIRSVTIFCVLLFLIEVIFVVARVWTSTEISKRGNNLQDFFVLLALIPEWIIVCCSTRLCYEDLDISSFFSKLLLIMCTSFVSYHLSWVAVGIMVNPAWGVSILLILSFFFVTVFFVINETTQNDDNRLYTFFLCVSSLLGLCFIVVSSVLVGQSFYGRETADDVLKAALLSVIGVVSWLYFKSSRASSNASQCVEAAKEAAAAAKALAEKTAIPEHDGTEVHFAIVAAATATACAAAAEAVAVALAAAKTENSKTTAVQCGNENSTSNGNGLSEETLPLNKIKSASEN